MKKKLMLTLGLSMLLGGCSATSSEKFQEEVSTNENEDIVELQNEDLQEFEIKTPTELTATQILDYSYELTGNEDFSTKAKLKWEVNENPILPVEGQVYYTIVALYKTSIDDTIYEHSFISAPTTISEYEFLIDTTLDRDLTGEFYIYTDVFNDENQRVWRSEKSESVFLK